MQLHRWRVAFSVVLTFGIIFLAYAYRERIWSAVSFLREAQPLWLILAFALELAGFFCASQVYSRVLRSMNYRSRPLRLWAIALVAIILSQSVPAGGVASYAFLVQSFRRQGISSGQSALVASSEALSYAGAMVLLFLFSLFYLAWHAGIGAAEKTGIVAALVAIVVIGGTLFLLTRDPAVMKRWLLAIKNNLGRILKRDWDDSGINKLVDDLAHGRQMIAARRRELVFLVIIQLLALTIHSLAMLIVLYSLGVSTSLLVVVAAFGTALITSTFNVLPGGGGTVEAVLVLSLTQLGIDERAIVAAVIFRLLNFWLLLPIAALCYRWLMHRPTP